MAALHNRLQPLLVVVLAVFVICEPHVEEENVANSIPGPSPVLQELRNRWGAADIVRDINHIKEDISKITQLQDTGDITTNEALFYFLRMHDFDDNGKLDGHELIAAMKHTTDHSGTDPMPFYEVEAIVDSFFAYDDNIDGFISYPEMRKHLGPSDEK